jgi:hypothetical protein
MRMGKGVKIFANVFVNPASKIRTVFKISLGQKSFLGRTTAGSVDIAKEELRREVFMVDLNRTELPDNSAVSRTHPNFYQIPKLQRSLVADSKFGWAWFVE